ncbi:tetratricopeptide repeat protein [Granulosicoccus sp.]|nr:tetratricopeptide repeat protein [Granulosicoccus sp.]MDB4222402.1 tetratricopeptide repeat protein [Granulosicoccus sp.]
MRGNIFSDVLDFRCARLRRLSAYLLIPHVPISQGFLKIKYLFVLLIGILLTSGCSTFAGNTTDQDDRNYDRSHDYNSSKNSIYQLMAQADSAYDAEDWLEASNRYREVLDKIPDDAYAWFRMGNSLTQLGRYGEAVVAYETSLATDNAQFKAWFNLSTTHLLNAKVVTLNALRSIGMNDPSRNKVERRLDVLTALLN